jgi:acetyl-CoA carboxylase biotin carboxylase subunit
MLRRVLIANRGEIALRILRACRELGLEAVAAHSVVDENQLHLRHADDTVCIGRTSYLDIPAMLAAAKSRGCDAVHPGYGMLAESAQFAQAVEAAELTFVGPRSETIEAMADKVNARQLALDAGLEILPGSGALRSVDAASRAAESLGYPILLKALSGGGGRGMRIVESDDELRSAFESASTEAEASFGDGSLYLEKYLTASRHIEVQVLGDGHGGALHLGTRECSIQRRHQKIIEEAPACGIDDSLVQAVLDRCIALTAGINYRGAGTLEFLYQDGKFFFIEMNARIQVEHPVTEMITGRDLVKAQLELAMEERLPFAQGDIECTGHAIECRINAEEHVSGREEVRPSPGLVYDIVVPGGAGVRVDSALYNGYVIPHEYDSLVAKLVTWGSMRHEAVVRMRRALDEFEIKGIATNIPLLKRIVADERFGQGVMDTHFLDDLGGTP